MLKWITKDVRTTHLYKWHECNSFMFVVNMHFEIESKRYIYSLLKFLFIMVATWVLTPLFVWSSWVDLRSWRNEVNSHNNQCFSDESKQYIKNQISYHQKNIYNSLWLVVLAPLLIAMLAFTHIKKEN